jgi:hypothetical protein
MKHIVALLVAAFVFTVPALTVAKEKADKAAGFHGKVTKVDDKSITVDNKKASESKTYTVDDSTKVKVDGADAKIADVKVGMTATVTTGGDKADVAASITATTPKKKNK